MTAPLLHRYCPDHTPDRALCGLDLVASGAEQVDPGKIEERDECLVCADLAPMPCENACRALRPEPETSRRALRDLDPPGGASGPAGRRPSPGGPLSGEAEPRPAPASPGNTDAGGES